MQPKRPARPTSRRAFLATSAALLASTALAGCAGFDPSSFSLPETGDTGPVADDASPLSADVQAALAATPATMHERIHVQAMRNGRVRLRGSVGSSSAASEAVRVANQVAGVSDVLDTLNVR